MSPLDSGEMVPLTGPIGASSVAAGARAVAESAGFQVAPERLHPLGIWRTHESGTSRHSWECFVLDVTGSALPDGGAWRDVMEWLDGFREGRMYPGPLYTAVLEAIVAAEGDLSALQEPFRAQVGLGAHPRIASAVEVVPLRTPTLPPATHTNCIIAGVERCVVIDPASPYPEEQERLRTRLETHMQRGAEVARIILTHHHVDHVGGVDALRAAFDVPVAAHAATADRLKGRVRVDEFLDEGDRVPIAAGLSLRVLHTPGHARGHIVLFAEEEGWMVAGDMVAGQGTIVIDPPEGNMEDYLAQLERMRSLQPRLLIPSHGPMILDPDACLQQLRTHRLWREGVILEALMEDGPQVLDVIVTRAYGDVHPAVHPIAARQVEAHLEKLIAEERVVRQPGPRWAPSPSGRD